MVHVEENIREICLEWLGHDRRRQIDAPVRRPMEED